MTKTDDVSNQINISVQTEMGMLIWYTEYDISITSETL